jgi:hypothetical protein
MSRFFRVRSEPIFGQEEVVIEVAQAEVGALALELTLLLMELTESISISFPEGHVVLMSLQDESEEMAKRTEVTKINEKRIRFELSRTQAGYLRATLLRAYRDDVAEVNHIHIEGAHLDASFDLTIFFQTSRPPMSTLEIERLMGD